MNNDKGQASDGKMDKDSGVPEERSSSSSSLPFLKYFAFLRYIGFIGEGRRHRPTGFFGYVFLALVLAITIYSLWLGSVGTHSALQYSMTFMAAMLPATFLTTTSSKRSDHLSVPDIVLASISLLVGVYLLLSIGRYLNWIQGLTQPTSLDVLAGIALVLLILEACRRTIGWGLTSVVLVLMAYTFFGQFIQGTFYHRPTQLTYFLEQQVFTTTGIFGEPVQVAATYAFLFVLFGNLFHKAGGGNLFFDIAAAFTGRMVGGPAKACIASAGLYGSISGSPTADVATTGQVNIPVMKRTGYTGTYSGAVESAASSGGALLPPVMGAVAFLMAEFTGIAYGDIARAALPVALLYYFGLFLQVHHRAQRWGIGRLPEAQIVGLGLALKRGWLYLIPLFILVYFLFAGYTPSTIAVSAAVSTVIVSWFKRDTRLGPRRLLDAFSTTVFMMVSLASAVAAAGLVIGAINLTGLAGKFTYLIFSVTGGIFIVTLIVAMIISILLGMGMPTPAVYVMTAALVAPALLDLGVPEFEAHLFLLYFAAMSAITPPIAVAAFTAAPIANANPMSIGWQAVRLAVVGFVFPFVFIFRPGLLLQGSVLEIIEALISGIVVAYALSAAVEGWFGRGPLAWWERIILVLAGAVIVYPAVITLLAGTLVVAALLAFRHRNPRWAPNPELRKPDSVDDKQPQEVPTA